MGLFARLFRRKSAPDSRLAQFLEELTERSIQEHTLAQKNAELRAPLLVSLIVLRTAGQFSRDLFTTLRSSKFPVAADTAGAERFDAVVFETAAFIHYALVAKGLHEAADDDDEDDLGSDEDDLAEGRSRDPYFELARDASQTSGILLSSLAAFEVTDRTFVTRAIAYSARARRRQSVIDVFSAVLIETIESGALATFGSRPVSLDLGLTLAVPMHVNAFAVSMLPAMQGIVRNAVDKAAELGLE